MRGMPGRSPLATLIRRTRAMRPAVRHLGAAALALSVFGLRLLLDPAPQATYPFGHFFVAILLAAVLFGAGASYVATLLSGLLGTWYYLPPTGSLVLPDPSDYLEVVLFLLAAATMTAVIEALHRAVQRVEHAQTELLRSERARALVLREFRHRTRNDLGSLVGLLMLRARTAPSDAARDALCEAADHALALARVHARLTLDDLEEGAEHATVDTREFISGLCADIEAAQFGQELRPVRLVAGAEAHLLSAERAVPLGLVLNETVTNALKYAFPEDRPGTVQVRFAREGEEFVLTVTDDGIGLPPEGELENAPPARPAGGSGLGTRLLRALAAQLRGRFTRRPGPDGIGTVAELRFAAAEPA